MNKADRIISLLTGIVQTKKGDVPDLANPAPGWSNSLRDLVHADLMDPELLPVASAIRVQMLLLDASKAVSEQIVSAHRYSGTPRVLGARQMMWWDDHISHWMATQLPQAPLMPADWSTWASECTERGLFSSARVALHNNQVHPQTVNPTSLSQDFWALWDRSVYLWGPPTNPTAPDAISVGHRRRQALLTDTLTHLTRAQVQDRSHPAFWRAEPADMAPLLDAGVVLPEDIIGVAHHNSRRLAGAPKDWGDLLMRHWTARDPTQINATLARLAQRHSTALGLFAHDLNLQISAPGQWFDGWSAAAVQNICTSEPGCPSAPPTHTTGQNVPESAVWACVLASRGTQAPKRLHSTLDRWSNGSVSDMCTHMHALLSTWSTSQDPPAALVAPTAVALAGPLWDLQTPDQRSRVAQWLSQSVNQALVSARLSPQTQPTRSDRRTFGAEALLARRYALDPTQSPWVDTARADLWRSALLHGPRDDGGGLRKGLSAAVEQGLITLDTADLTQMGARHTGPLMLALATARPGVAPRSSRKM